VREVLDGPRPVSRVSVEIGVGEGTLRRWVQLERRRRESDPAAPVPAVRGGDAGSDAARIRELERQLREARQEAEFLKKAAAFFARDHR
jgi:transposase-like protein